MTKFYTFNLCKRSDIQNDHSNHLDYIPNQVYI